MTAFQVISVIAIFSAAIIPIYISIRVRGPNKFRIRTITIILVFFILIHGLYHLAELFGYDRLGEGLLEPLSVVILILFGVMMIRILNPNTVLTNNHRGGLK